MPSQTHLTYRDMLREFNASLNWGQFHNPKNFAMCLATEVLELNDRFDDITHDVSRGLSKNATHGYYQKSVEEVADCYRGLVSLNDSLGLPLLENKLNQRRDSPKFYARQFSKVAKKLVQPFVWVSEEYSKTILQADEVEGKKIVARLQTAYTLLLTLARELDMDIVAAAYAKHEQIAERYSKEKSWGNASKQ